MKASELSQENPSNPCAGAAAERCPWAGTDPLYQSYHDTEWGRPITATDALFELLMLEGQQAGLAWITVLRKREAMRKAFFAFDRHRLANAGDDDLQRWLGNADVIRHRGKLAALIKNARAVNELIERNGDNAFVDLLWSFTDGQTQVNRHVTLATVPPQTSQSQAMSKALKKLGLTFVGPTICYAFMQSAGMVNDHLVSCPAFEPCRALAR